MFKKFLTGFLIFLFTLVALPAFFIWSVYDTFLNPDFYSGAFVEDAYDSIVTVGPTLVDLKEFHSLTSDDIRELFQKVFTKEDLAQFFDSTIERFISALHDIKGEKIKIKIPLDLLSKKRDIISKEISDLLYKKLPKCGKNVVSEECIPPNMSQIDFGAQIKHSMDKEVVASMPNEFVVNMKVPKEISGDIGGFITKAFAWFFSAVVLFLLLILFLLFLIIKRPWFRVLRVEAKAFFIPSVFMSIFLSILLFSSDIFWKLYNYFKFDLELKDALFIKSVLNLAFSSFAKHALLYIIPFLIISLGLLVVAMVYGRKQVPPQILTSKKSK